MSLPQFAAAPSTPHLSDGYERAYEHRSGNGGEGLDRPAGDDSSEWIFSSVKLDGNVGQ